MVLKKGSLTGACVFEKSVPHLLMRGWAVFDEYSPPCVSMASRIDSKVIDDIRQGKIEKIKLGEQYFKNYLELTKNTNCDVDRYQRLVERDIKNWISYK